MLMLMAHFTDKSRLIWLYLLPLTANDDILNIFYNTENRCTLFNLFILQITGILYSRSFKHKAPKTKTPIQAAGQLWKIWKSA